MLTGSPVGQPAILSSEPLLSTSTHTVAGFESIQDTTVTSDRGVVAECFFLAGLFCVHRLWMEWATLVIGTQECPSGIAPFAVRWSSPTRNHMR